MGQQRQWSQRTATLKEPTMNTRRNHRLAAALASMAITFTLFAAVVANAERPVPGALLAQADTAPVR
jgi:hypothetical protein